MAPGGIGILNDWAATTEELPHPLDPCGREKEREEGSDALVIVLLLFGLERPVAGGGGGGGGGVRSACLLLDRLGS